MIGESEFDLTQSEKVINRFAFRVQRRIRTLPQGVMSLDDIKQELWIAWCKARDNFEPSRGIPFEPYLRRGMINHINSVIKTQIEKFPEQTFALSLDAKVGDEDMTLMDVIPSSEKTAESFAEELSNWNKGISVLSPRAKLFVSILESQPEELLQECLLGGHKKAQAVKVGAPYVNQIRITSQMVFDLMGASTSERRKIVMEVERVGAKLSNG